MKTTVIVVAAILFHLPAMSAGSLSGGKVLMVRVDKGGQGMVVFDRPVGGERPSCVVPYYANALSFDLATPGGKGILATALAAKAAGAALEVHGTGACSVYGGAYVEDWSYGVLTQ